MVTTIRRLGNSQGILIPKPLLQQVGLSDQVELLVDGETLILRKPRAAARAGWAESGRKLLESGVDTPVLLDFANEDDVDLQW